LKPSEDLANVIGVVLGDGYTYEEKSGRCVIRLRAKDKEFVEDFGRRLANVLGREPIRPRKDAGLYIAEAKSKTLHELLKKPVDLKRIKKYVEHCPKCAAAFLRGLFDSEGCVSKEGYIKLINSNYEVLVYAQRLLRKFGIESTGPWPHKQKGTTMHDPRTRKQYKTNEDCYYLYIGVESLLNFYLYIGFTIRRKQKRLEEYLRMAGKLLRAPAASRWSGEPRPRKNTPCGGLAVLRALDDYQMFTGRFSDALSHHIPGQGRPPGPNGGQAYSGAWRGVQGSPGGEGAERDSLDTPSQ
jgi:intein-encoded DNA endonuclease-like protein